MKIKLAKVLGYCPGVKKAMDTAFGHLASRGSAKVYSHGELIHNNPTLDLLANKGLHLWQGEKEGVVIVRAHGLPPSELAQLEQSPKLLLSDATCSRVRFVQNLVANYATQGYLVIIWGKANHPEVVGILGHTEARGQVVGAPGEVAALPEASQVLLVSQTTQDLTQWPQVVEAVQARWPEAVIKNTICKATELRQAEVQRLTTEVDVLVIIGGKTSANTARLADIGLQAGLKTIVVEDLADLNQADFTSVETVGVAAGASTSTWQIAQVLQALRALARSHHSFGSFGPRLLRALVLGGLWSALGLASLAWCAGYLLGQNPAPIIFSFFFFQGLSLRLFRDFVHHRSQSQSLALQLRDPDRTSFFSKYPKVLKILFLLAATSGALAALGGGEHLFQVWALSWVILTIYLFAPRPVLAAGLNRTIISQISLAGALALAMIWANLPEPMDFPGAILTTEVAFVFWILVGPMFVLSTLMDVLGVQGDLVFARPTLPSVFGEKITRAFLAGFLGVGSVVIVLGAVTANLPSLAWLILLSGPVYNFLLLKLIFPSPARHDLSPSLHGFYFEALMYGQLLLTGALTWLWYNL